MAGQDLQRAKEFPAPHPTSKGLGGHKEPRGDTARTGDPRYPGDIADHVTLFSGYRMGWERKEGGDVWGECVLCS